MPRTRIFNVRPSTTNVGNDLIALGLARMLELTWPEPLDLVNLPAQAAGGNKGSGLDARNVYEINQLADGVIVGGGNLFENGGLNIEPRALEALQVPLALWAISTGRVYGRDRILGDRTDGLPDSSVAALCGRAEPILVRDEPTGERLAALTGSEPHVTGCPSMFLDRVLDEPPEPASEVSGTALLSVRNPAVMSVPYSEQQRVRDDVRRIAQLLAGRYDEVALLCHDYKDLAFAESFPELSVMYTEDVGRFLSWIRGCAVSVTYRLHGFLACVSMDTPSIHVSYDERGESIVELLGLEEWNVPMIDTADVAGELRSRLDALGGKSVRRDAGPALDLLFARTQAGLEHFAGRVAAARELRESIASGTASK